MRLVVKAPHHTCTRHAPYYKSTPSYLQKAAQCGKAFHRICRRHVACAFLQKHSTLFAEGMRLAAKAPHLICRRHAPCSKTLHTIAEDMRFVAKVLHFSCRRHAHCCSSALLYLQKTRVLLQKHSTLFTEGMRLVAKALHLFAEGVRPSSKALHFSCRRHAPGCKSIPL